MKRSLSDVRQTYIFLYESDGIKYIFNRSIPWNVINFKKLELIIDLLGEDAINHILNKLSKMDDSIVSLTREWYYDDKVFTILEIHTEWENINLENQKEINERKELLGEEYGAIISKKDIEVFTLPGDIVKEIKMNLQRYLKCIYDAIHLYNKEITKLYEPRLLEQQTLLNDLKNEVNTKRNESRMLSEKIKRQNYVLNNPNKYFDQKYKQNIIYSKI